MRYKDLSDFHSPPPWRSNQLEAVLAQIANMHESAADLPAFEVLHGRNWVNWPVVAEDKERFLRLGLVIAKMARTRVAHSVGGRI